MKKLRFCFVSSFHPALSLRLVSVHLQRSDSSREVAFEDSMMLSGHYCVDPDERSKSFPLPVDEQRANTRLDKLRNAVSINVSSPLPPWPSVVIACLGLPNPLLNLPIQTCQITKETNPIGRLLSKLAFLKTVALVISSALLSSCATATPWPQFKPKSAKQYRELAMLHLMRVVLRKSHLGEFGLQNRSVPVSMGSHAELLAQNLHQSV